MKKIETERLILNDLELSDLDRFYAYAKKPNIGPMAGWHPHQSLDESHLIIRMMMSDQDVWAIRYKAENRLIGTIGLHVRNFDNAMKNQKEIGYVIDDTYWGLGITVEAVLAVLHYAFIDEALDRVLCGHKASNLQSKRVIEKTNFIYTHTETREDHLKQPVEILMYEITREDYLRRLKNEQS
jgi:putative acetyltransferase